MLSPSATDPVSAKLMLGQRRNWLNGPSAAVAASWLVMATAIAWANQDFLFTAKRSKILASALSIEAMAGPLGLAIVWFLIALLTIHGLLGLAAWSMAKATALAAPRLRVAPLGLTIAWLLLFLILAWLGNATLYPASKFAPEAQWFSTFQVFGLRPVGIAVSFVAVSMTLILSVAASRIVRERATGGSPRMPVRLAALFLPLAAFGSVHGLSIEFESTRQTSAGVGTPSRPPSIILIGIDSLRCDLSLGPSQAAEMPEVEAFLADAHRFTDATTPLARTFPSWVSVLTGRHPVTTNARVNLTPRGLLNVRDTLPSVLASRGYTTVYATDEVRFANIDASYGFHQVVTPPIGAADFLLGKLNDIPLSNLLSSTIASRWLFPHTYGNRAAHVTYRPEAFERLLDEQLRAEAPLFLALHLTLAHWPYSFAGQPYTEAQPTFLRDAYAESLQAVDAQFGRIMRLLEQRGMLDNAIVVLLSDHGEGMGWYSESLMQPIRPIHEVWGSLWGHGTSVMTPHQFQVLLAFRGFGAAATGKGATHLLPASLEDIRPTVMQLAGVRDPFAVDGLSLADAIRGHSTAGLTTHRVRFTETDFNTPSMLKGKLDENGALSEAGMYYEVDPASGWVQLRANRIGEIINAKERAAFDDELLLAALPDGSGGHDYLLTSRRNPFPMRLKQTPDPLENPRAARLWQALHDRYGGELQQLGP
jgi:hypothetical protein